MGLRRGFEPTGARARGPRGRPRLTLIGWGLLCGLALAPAARASALAGGDDPAGRGLQLLQARETALGNQTAQASDVARQRGRMLYGLLLHEAAERRSGAPNDPARRQQAGAAPGGRAIALGVAILARDLDEAAVLRDELARVREERRTATEGMARAGGAAPGAAAAATGAEKLCAPVAGPMTSSWGVARDEATGGWLFRTAAGWSPRPGAPVVAPADGRVARVVPDVGGGWAVVLAHPGGLTSVLGGLGSVAVSPRELVRRGAPVGSAGAAVRLEVSRGRTPVDPATLLAVTGGRAPRIAVAPRAPGRIR